MWRMLCLFAMMWASQVLAQDDDPGLLTRFLQNNLSDAGRTVTISGFQGALSSRATIAQLTVADGAGVWLTLKGVTLDWNRAAVLRGRFSVNELSADEIIVARRPVRDVRLPAPEAKGFALPELPISIEIGKVAAHRLALGPDVLGTSVEASLDAALRLADGEGQGRLSLLRTDGGPQGKLALEASYSNASGMLAIDLDAEEAAGGIVATAARLPGVPATQLVVKGQGIVDDFAAAIRLATDGVDRLSGQITLKAAAGGRDFAANLAGNPAPLFLPEQAAFFGTDVRLDVAGRRSADGALDLSKLKVQTEALSLDGTLALAPDGLPVRFALQGRIARADGGAVLLPFGGVPTRIRSADLGLHYDAAADEGWRGSAGLQGLQRPDLALDSALISGSGRIRRGAGAQIIGATLRLVAAGVQPSDPRMATALGPALSGQAKLVWQQGTPLQFSDVTLAGGDYTVRMRGRIGGLGGGFALDGHAEATAEDLGRFSALAGRPLGGRAALDATGRGSVLGGDFDLAGTLRGTALTFGQAEADRLLAGASEIAFSVARTIAGTQVRKLAMTAANLSVEASGWLRSTGNDLVADLRFDDLKTLGQRYRGSLTGKATFSGTADAGRATLDATAVGLAVGQAQADRLLNGQSTLSVALRTEKDAVAIDKLNLNNPQVTIEAGELEGVARRTVALSARLADLGLLLGDFPGSAAIKGTVVQDGSDYVLDLRATGPGQIDAAVTGRVTPATMRSDLTIAGSAQAALANPFIAPRSVAGPVRFDMALRGPLALSALSGRIALDSGRIAAPSLSLALDDVNAAADLGDGTATVSADARVVAGGHIRVRGSVGLSAPNPGDLAITARDVVLRDPELYETRATGNIRVGGPLAGGALISGTIDLPEIEVRVPSTGITGAGTIPDLDHRHEPAAVRATRARAGLVAEGMGPRTGFSRPYALDLAINAPSRVFIRGRGLDAELGGQLRLSGTTEAVVPSGAIDLIRGRLDILGRRLDLSEAQVRLEGSLDPRLHVVASNASSGITSSVVIDGLISAPDISFTSMPPLPQEEVLAHLLFGRQLNALSPLQAAQLANAVATLAGRGGEGIIGTLRRNFGLDDLDLVTDPQGGASLRIGRYISKNVYTDVIVGANGKSKLNLNLDVRPGVTVRGSADSEGGTGFGVFVERDY